MNYFIDFDHTLYNTKLLTNDMIESLAKYINNPSAKNYDENFEFLKNKFQRGEIYNIYELIEFLAKKYKIDKNEATNNINKILFEGSKYVYDDSIKFLQYIKQQGNKIYILSYNEDEVYFQTVKIAGSGLLKYVDGVIPTITSKSDMPFDFSKCIFIDDKPKDLISIYKKQPYKIYRIRRKNDTYSNIETNLPIAEFVDFEKLLDTIRKDCE